MDVQDSGRFLDDVMVNGRLLNAALLQLRDNRTEFRLRQHKVSSGDCALVVGLHGRPRTEREGRANRHARGRDLEVAARHPVPPHVTRLHRAGSAEGRIDLRPLDGRRTCRGSLTGSRIRVRCRGTAAAGQHGENR